MFSSFVVKLFLIVHLITISCQSKYKCNGSCLTKTYYYQNLASATFTAKQMQGINYLTIILTGYEIKESEYQMVSVWIGEDTGINIYSCERNTSGFIAAYYDYSGIQVPSGSSLYRDNTLYCFWTMSRETADWPKSGNDFMDLETDPNHKILLSNDKIGFLAAQNTADLPIYQMNFLKCCNEVYGNEKIQLFVRQTDNSNDFTFQLMDNSLYTASFVTVELKDADDASEIICIWGITNVADLFCYLNTKYIELLPLNSQVLYNYTWSSRVFTWSIPVVITGLSEDYDTRNRVYDLKITLNSDDSTHSLTSVYSKNGISLKSLGSTRIPNTFFVFSVFLLLPTFC